MELSDNNDSRDAAKPTNAECTICRKSFLHAKNLEEHILRKHVNEKDKIFQCTECFETKQLVKCFAAQRILNVHIREAHGPPRFKCPVCLKTLKSSSSFTKHKLIHSQTDMTGYKHKCHLCTKAFLVKSRLQSHLFHIHKQKLENVNYFKCELCSREFVCRSALESHVVQNHVVDKAFECLVCSQKFISQEVLEKHIRKHDKERSHVCDICSKGFTQKINLISHLGVNHNHFFYCDLCLTSFKNKSEFDAHISDSKPQLKCSLCQQFFISECHLKTHTDSHVKEIKADKKECNVDKPTNILETDELIQIKLESTKNGKFEKFHCELCSKSFDREAYFKAHRNLVHQNAEWKCNFEQCCKSFKRYREFKLHQLGHSQTKLFVCNICKKPFHRPANLRMHKKSHAQEKNHKCEQCPNSFITSPALRIHIAMKHGGPKLFKCPQVDCGTSWASSARLKIHLVCHQTERAFKCELCKPVTAFKSLRHLKMHQHRVHLNKNKKFPTQQPLSAKYFDAVVFSCSLKTCSFETRSEAEVALHYNEKHELPKVLIFRISSSSSPLLPSVSQKTERMIHKRYKCEVCFRSFEFPSRFSQHLETHSNEPPCQCSFCSKSFKLRRYLKDHVKKMHSKLNC